MIKEDTEKCCRTCEFNAGNVCMGTGKRVDNRESVYGMTIKEAMEMFPNGCSDWGISLQAFIDAQL